NKMNYMTTVDPELLGRHQVCLSTTHSSTFSAFFEFPTPPYTFLIPCEFRGLPILFASTLNQISVLHFNFTPTPEEEPANTALKVDAFICRYWRQIHSAFGDVGLFAFFLWMRRRKLP
ncbi:MAG TPA: hypothetical protein VHK67_00670, partial [Rhabdochlamydiaceae bacterium]|nr:hypothetical protein [Rhabdochlamydiaceae bacterium]